MQCSTRPYTRPEDNVLKSVASAQLFLTLFISVVLRTDLHKDALNEDEYGLILTIVFFSAPVVALISTAMFVVRVRNKRKATSTVYEIDTGKAAEDESAAEQQPGKEEDDSTEVEEQAERDGGQEGKAGDDSKEEAEQTMEP